QRPIFRGRRRRPSPELRRERSVIDLRLETRVRQFTNTSDRPTNTLRDGAQTRFGGSYSYYLAPGVALIIQDYSQPEDAEAGLYTSCEVGGPAGIAWPCANPRAAAGRYPWTLPVGAGGIHRRYDDPDPTISPTQYEVDRQFWGRAALLAMVPQVEIRDQD